MERTFSFIKKARNLVTKLSLYLKIKLGWLGVPKIVPFIGYSNGTTTFITGKVVEDNGISKPVEGQSKWVNAITMLKRYFADEFAGVKVLVTFLGQAKTVVTNNFGVFSCEFQHLSNIVPDEIWQKTTFELTEKIHSHQKHEIFEGEVMMIKNKPQFGIISDIDDTILVSYATNKLMKFRLMFFNNALTRMPFEGVSAFYEALQSGNNNNAFNPIFYLSNSEWDIYDLLYEFVEFNRIPKGPLLLRGLVIHVLRFWKMREYNKNHKVERLRHLFSIFPDLKFILIGDNGQKDPEVYSGIIKEFPGRVLTVYIRDTGINRRAMRIQTVSKSPQEALNVEMVLVKDTEAAARHAINKGYIRKRELSHIRDKKQKDLEKKAC